MNPKISKWIDFCDGALEFDDYSEFLDLLTPKWSRDDLDIIFRSVPLKNQVIQNLEEVYEASLFGGVYLRPNPTNRGSRDELTLLVSDFIESQKRHLQQQVQDGVFELDGAIRSWIDEGSQKVNFVSSAAFQRLDPNLDLSLYVFELEHHYLEYCDEAELELNELQEDVQTRVMCGLDEALYGISGNYYLGFFILLPILKTSIDYRRYFDFWKRGGRYYMTETEIIIEEPPTP